MTLRWLPVANEGWLGSGIRDVILEYFIGMGLPGSSIGDPSIITVSLERQYCHPTPLALPNYIELDPMGCK